MSRVIQVRIRGLDAGDRDALQARFSELVAGREWRDGTPWLADERSPDLLPQLFFDQALTEPAATAGSAPLSAAALVRISRGEADALALIFIVRDRSQRFQIDAALNGPDNPIRKLRSVVLRNG